MNYLIKISVKIQSYNNQQTIQKTNRNILLDLPHTQHKIRKQMYIVRDENDELQFKFAFYTDTIKTTAKTVVIIKISA